MNTGRHILTSFNEDLDNFKQKTVLIGCLTKHNLTNALQGLLERNLESCNKAIAEDEEVDQLEMDIDENGVLLMTKYHPVASDLRMILASIKITNAIERISDHAVSIAKRSRKLLRHSELNETLLIEPIYHHSFQMFTDSLIAYTDGNEKLAREIIARDEKLSELHKNATKQLTKCLEKDNGRHKDYVNLVFISRWLERVGDLSVNIAEDVIYMLTATDIRHGAENT